MFQAAKRAGAAFAKRSSNRNLDLLGRTLLDDRTG